MSLAIITTLIALVLIVWGAQYIVESPLKDLYGILGKSSHGVPTDTRSGSMLSHGQDTSPNEHGLSGSSQTDTLTSTEDGHIQAGTPSMVGPYEEIPVVGEDDMSGGAIVPLLPVSSGSQIAYESGSYHLYEHTTLHYGFALPKYTYYLGYGARDGAVHSMAVALTSSGVEVFESAPVQVWYYRKKPTTDPSHQFITLTGGVLYVKNNDTTADQRITKIVETILASAH